LEYEHGYPCIHRLLMRYIQGYPNWTCVYDAYIKFPIQHAVFSTTKETEEGLSVNNVVENIEENVSDDQIDSYEDDEEEQEEANEDEINEDLKSQNELLEETYSDIDSDYERERKAIQKSFKKSKSNAGIFLYFSYFSNS